MLQFPGTFKHFPPVSLIAELRNFQWQLRGYLKNLKKLWLNVVYMSLNQHGISCPVEWYNKLLFYCSWKLAGYVHYRPLNTS